MNYFLWISMLLTAVLVGCAPAPATEQSQATGVVTATVREQTATAMPTAVQPSATAVVPTIAPSSTPTLEATESPTATTTPTVIASTNIIQHCGTSSSSLAEDSTLAQGLVANERGRLSVLDATDLQNPLWQYPYSDDPSADISPNGNWVAFITYTATDAEDERYSLAIRVTDWTESQEFHGQFDDLKFSRFTKMRWLNDTEIVFPLMNEGELFQWLVWSPFSGEEEMLSVELPDITERQRFLEYASPNPDPLSELVVYPCEACDGAEYAVRKFQTGEVVWQIDLGPDPAYVYRSPAYWAPNGQYFTVMGGKYLNQLLFFNREGEKIHEINLPPLDYPDMLTIFSWSWSPDSNYLAFFRLTGSEGNYERRLTYVDVGNGQLVDFCFHGKGDWPIWSPDSSMIAVSQQVESEQTARLISIINIHSGDVVQLDDAEGFNLMDWVSLVDER